MLFAPEIIKILAPFSYYEAIYVIPPVTASIFFQFLYSAFSNIEFYYEKPQYVSVASIGAAIINIALNAMLIPLFGYIIAGYTTLFCYILLSIFHYILMSKLINKTSLFKFKIFDLKFIIQISIITVLVTCFVSFIYGNIFIRYFFILVIFITVIINKNKIQLILADMKNKE